MLNPITFDDLASFRDFLLSVKNLPENFEKQFIVADDGNTYLVSDITKLEDPSSLELTFPCNNAAETCTLSQIKQNFNSEQPIDLMLVYNRQFAAKVSILLESCSKITTPDIENTLDDFVFREDDGDNCSISYEKMLVPAINLVSGAHYEYKQIYEALSYNKKDPITRYVTELKNVVVDKALADIYYLEFQHKVLSDPVHIAQSEAFKSVAETLKGYQNFIPAVANVSKIKEKYNIEKRITDPQELIAGLKQIQRKSDRAIRALVGGGVGVTIIAITLIALVLTSVLINPIAIAGWVLFAVGMFTLIRSKIFIEYSREIEKDVKEIEKIKPTEKMALSAYTDRYQNIIDKTAEKEPPDQAVPAFNKNKRDSMKGANMFERRINYVTVPDDLETEDYLDFPRQ